PLSTRVSAPSTTCHAAGIVCSRKPRHPAVVLPSKRSIIAPSARERLRGALSDERRSSPQSSQRSRRMVLFVLCVLCGLGGENPADTSTHAPIASVHRIIHPSPFSP